MNTSFLTVTVPSSLHAAATVAAATNPITRQTRIARPMRSTLPQGLPHLGRHRTAQRKSVFETDGSVGLWARAGSSATPVALELDWQTSISYCSLTTIAARRLRRRVSSRALSYFG